MISMVWPQACFIAETWQTPDSFSERNKHMEADIWKLEINLGWVIIYLLILLKVSENFFYEMNTKTFWFILVFTY